MADDRVKITIAALDQTKAAFESVRNSFRSLDSQSRSSVSSISSDWKKVGAVIGTVFSTYQAAAFIKEVVGAQVAMERMNVAMESALGSSQASADSMAFVREEAKRLGLSLQESAQGYIKIAAAAKGTALEGEPVKEIFTAVSEAATALQLSVDDTDGALRAISQMMSKGKISAEELRQQLGEQLPGAFQVAAKAMGVSTAQLDKMLVEGKLMSDDFLPKFAAALRQHFSGAIDKASQSTAANLNRMKTAIFDFKVALGEAFGSATQDSVGAITTAMERFRKEVSKPEAQEAIRKLSEEFAELIVNAGEKAPEAFRKVLEGLNSIMTFYNALPGWVVEAAGMGIVGKMLFGAGPGKIILAIGMINGALSEVGNSYRDIVNTWSSMLGNLSNIKDVMTGKRDWNTGALQNPQATGLGLADPAGLAKAEAALLAKPKASGSGSGTGGTSSNLSTTVKKAEGEYARLVEKARQFQLTAAQEVELSGLSGLRKELRQNEIEAENLREEYRNLKGAERDLTFAAIEQQQAMKDKAAVEKEVEAQRAAGVKTAKELAQFEKEMADLAQENAEKRLAAQTALINAQLYELDLAEQAGMSWRNTIEARIALTQKLLDLETGKLEGIDKGMDLAGYNSQLRVVQDLQSRMIGLKNQNDELVGSFSDGWTKAWDDWQANSLTAFTAGREMAVETAQAMQDSFSDYFFDVIEGRFNTLEDVLTAFAHKINQILADIMARTAVNYVYNGLSSGLSSLIGAGASLLGGWSGGGETTGASTGGGTITTQYGTSFGATMHSGGLPGEAKSYRLVPSSAYFGAPRYHSGIGPGEVAAVLRQDEGVFTPGQMKNMASLSSIVAAIKSSAGGNGGNSLSVSVPVSVPFNNKALIAEMQSRIEQTVIGVVRKYA